jgi:hypothetical protein
MDTPYHWLDTIEAVNPNDVPFQEVLVDPTATTDDTDTLSHDALIRRETKFLKHLQQAYLKSNLYLGEDGEPYAPMLELVDQHINVSLFITILPYPHNSFP